MIAIDRVFRRLRLGLLALFLLVLSTSSISTSGIKVVSYTQVLSGTTNTFSFPSANPCGGQPRRIVLTSNGSFRISMLASGPNQGSLWISPLQRGTFVIAADSLDQPSYSGRFDLLPDTNLARQGEITFVLHLVGRGSDGSALDARLLEHLSVKPNKVTISAATPSFLATPVACS